jgi:hypothetical protein
MAQTNEISKIEAQRSTEVAASETSSVLSMIERAARDPNVDLDKMERLMRMRRDMLAEEAERAFNLAMRAAQAEMRPIAANEINTQTRSKYATYDQLDRVLRPIYTKHGFSMSFDEADSPKPEHIRVVCYVAHDAGHTRTYRKDMPADGKGAKGGDVMTKTHAAGSAASYGARYLMKGIWNVAIGEDDKDGNSPPEAISPDQLATLREKLDATGSDVRRFCEAYRIEALPDMPASRFSDAMAKLKQKEARR